MQRPYNAAHDGPQTLEQGFATLLANKQRAAESHFKPTPAGVEKPREVYLAACAQIGEALAADGFRYLKSGPKCTKAVGEFVWEISFWSNHNNVPGEYVELAIGACVRSRRYKKWQQEKGLVNPDDGVAGGELGYLRPEHSSLRWELADPGNRAQVIEGALRAIRELGFTYMDVVTDLPQFRELLQKCVVPLMWIQPSINVLMCFGGRDEAIAAGRTFFARHPEVVAEYRHELKRTPDRLPLNVNGQGYAKELAILSRFYDLGDLSDDGKGSVSPTGRGQARA